MLNRTLICNSHLCNNQDSFPFDFNSAITDSSVDMMKKFYTAKANFGEKVEVV